LHTFGLIANDHRGIRDRLPLRIFHKNMQVAGGNTLPEG
jgi:hypothetical protein